MIDPGQLTTRLTLQAPVESDDGQGGVRAQLRAAGRWCGPGRAAASRATAIEADDARRRSARDDHAPRRRRAVAAHRLGDGALIYRIMALARASTRGALLEIDAELRLS